MSNIEDRIENLEYAFGIKGERIKMSPEEMEKRLDRLCSHIRESDDIEPENDFEKCLDRDERIALKMGFINKSLKKNQQNNFS